MSQDEHEVALDDWTISWESPGDHRLWCKQAHPHATLTMAVVMLNPGSLDQKGANLRRDTTLRILRDVFLNTGYNPLIVNLFTFATPRPYELFENWESRDHTGFDLGTVLLEHKPLAVMYAYGAYEKDNQFGAEVLERIMDVRNAFSGLPAVAAPLSKKGTPKHPMRIQIEKRKDEYRNLIAQQRISTAGQRA